MARGQGVLSRIKITLSTDGQPANGTSRSNSVSRTGGPIPGEQVAALKDTIKTFFNYWHHDVIIESFETANQDQNGLFDLVITVGLGNKKTGTQSSPTSLASFLTQGDNAGMRTAPHIEDGKLIWTEAGDEEVEVDWTPASPTPELLNDAHDAHTDFIDAINPIDGTFLIFRIEKIQDTNNTKVWAQCKPFWRGGTEGDYTNPNQPMTQQTAPPPYEACPPPEASAEQRRLYPEPDPEYEP